MSVQVWTGAGRPGEAPVDVPTPKKIPKRALNPGEGCAVLGPQGQPGKTEKEGAAGVEGSKPRVGMEA